MDSKDIVINLINNRIERISANHISRNLTSRSANKELERLRYLKVVMENLTISSVEIQKRKLDKKIKILKERYNIWLYNSGLGKEDPKAQALYNVEVGMAHLYRQRRNLNYIIELSSQNERNQTNI